MEQNKCNNEYVLLNDRANLQNEYTLQPVVSVVVATYRRDAVFRRALESLMNQTYQYIEVIVVDDNANSMWNDKVYEIIKGIELQHNNQIIYIKNKTNKGSAEARNIGISIASGAYITFLDDNDVYMPNKIRNQVIHMIEMKSEYSLTDFYLCNEHDKIIEKRDRRYIKHYDKDNLLRYPRGINMGPII